MERPSVALRDSLSPRNPKQLILMLFVELPGLQQSGLEHRRYSKNLYAAISKATNLLSQIGRTKHRFCRLYVFCKYPNAIRAVCKGDNSPPILGDPFSAKPTGGTCAYLLSNPYEGFNPTNPQYDAGRRTEPPVSVPSALQKDISSTRYKLENVLADASHSPAATAAALPPELPPAERPSLSPNGLMTGPWMEYLFNELCKI